MYLRCQDVLANILHGVTKEPAHVNEVRQETKHYPIPYPTTGIPNRSMIRYVSDTVTDRYQLRIPIGYGIGYRVG